MPGLEGLPPLPVRSRLAGLLRGSGYTLLPEPDGFNLVSGLRYNDVTLGWVSGRALRLVESGDTGHPEQGFLALGGHVINLTL